MIEHLHHLSTNYREVRDCTEGVYWLAWYAHLVYQQYLLQMVTEERSIDKVS